MKRLKYTKLFEEFDLDKFMENPEEHYGNSEEGEIEEGDWVTSYRGTGQVLKMDKDFARVELTGSKRHIVMVPVFALKKMKRPETENDFDTKEKLAEISQSLNQYIETVTPDEDSRLNNPEAVVDWVESELLLDVISLSKRDPDTGSYPEYDSIVTQVALLMDIAMESDPDLSERAEAVLDKFYELSR